MIFLIVIVFSLYVSVKINLSIKPFIQKSTFKGKITMFYFKERGVVLV